MLSSNRRRLIAAFHCAFVAGLLAACTSNDEGPRVQQADAGSEAGCVGSACFDGQGPTDGAIDAADGPTADTTVQPARWELIGDAAVARYRHSATLLADGRVLIAGGETGTEHLATTRVYDPAANSFQDAGSLSVPRSLHSATLLADGRVLLVGGENDSGTLASAELFDPSQPSDQAWTPAAAMLTARYYHTATRLNDGRVLVTGGSNGESTSAAYDNALIYDPAANNWLVLRETLTEHRARHRAVRLVGGQVLIAGGGLFGGASDTMEVYNPTSGTFSAIPTRLSIRRQQHAMVALQDGRVFIDGGYCRSDCSSKRGSDLYDPVLDVIQHVSPPIRPTFAHVSIRLSDDRVLRLGGTADLGARDTSLPSKALAFSATAPSGWQSLPDMSESRYEGHTATLLGDRSVLVVGGLANDITLPGPTRYELAGAARLYNP